jgi:histone deacetylase HOS3
LEPPAPTASSVAADLFAQEWALHQSTDIPTKTIALVHDACYGHLFSRLGYPEHYLQCIVERPERIRSSALGIAAAYVRLGQRYEGERYAPNPTLNVPTLPVPFNIRKTDRKLSIQSPTVTEVHGFSWMSEFKDICNRAESKLAMGGDELARSFTVQNDKVIPMGDELHSGDLYLGPESLNAIQGALGGVCDGVDAVLGPGPVERAFVCVRPPGHHCTSDWPSGFCWINNVHVGISHAVINYGLTHAAIIDFDLHHGDGSQDIVWKHSTRQQEHRSKMDAAQYSRRRPPPPLSPYEATPIGYLSLHDIESFPCEDGNLSKTTGASTCIETVDRSIWNVHLDEWEKESEFWKLYEDKYSMLITKTRSFLRRFSQRVKSSGGHSPKGAIFISAGFDASEWENSSLNRKSKKVPTEFYARFTADIVRMAQEKDLGVDGRIISVLEGGYSQRALYTGVLAHLAGLNDENRSGAGYSYDPKWWSSASMRDLEGIMTGPSKPRGFLSPTVASSNKLAASGQDRKPGDDLPSVSCAVATHELSKLIIPSGIRTTSYSAAELPKPRISRRKTGNLGDTTPSDDLLTATRLRSRASKTPTPPLPSTPPARQLSTPKSKGATSRRQSGRPKTPRTAKAAVPEVPPVPTEHLPLKREEPGTPTPPLTRLVLRGPAPPSLPGDGMDQSDRMLD